MTPAVAACLIGAAVLGFDPRYDDYATDDDATDNDAATVDEVVG